MNFLQKAYRYLRIGNPVDIARSIPIINLVTVPKFTRYTITRILIITFVVVPFIGIFRRLYIRNKYRLYLEGKKQVAELQLKESIAKFDLKIPKGTQYMVIINLSQMKQGHQDQISQIDKQNSKNFFNLIQQAQDNQQARSLKWAFIGSKKLYQIIQSSRSDKKSASKQKLDVEFHQNIGQKKQVKVFLVGHDSQGQQKIVMQWSSGVGYKQISKYIAKHKYKKFLRQVNF